MRDIKFIEEVVEYFISNESTVRETAKHFGISKSSVHHYLRKVLPNAASDRILRRNKAEAPFRAGFATHLKAMKKRSL